MGSCPVSTVPRHVRSTQKAHFSQPQLGAIKTEPVEDDTGSKRSEWARCATEYESLFDESEEKQLRSKDGLFHKPQWLNAFAEKGETLVDIFWPLWLVIKCDKQVFVVEMLRGRARMASTGTKNQVATLVEPRAWSRIATKRCRGTRLSRAPTRCLSQPSWIRCGTMSRTQHVWTSQV